MPRSSSESDDGTSPPAGLDAAFCARFKGVCADCPNKSRRRRRSEACEERIQLPPFAEAAIEMLSHCRRLTGREHEVLTLCCGGAKNTMIAKRLGISLSAVRRHLRNLHKKTSTSDKTELILNLWHSCQVPGRRRTFLRKASSRSRRDRPS